MEYQLTIVITAKTATEAEALAKHAEVEGAVAGIAGVKVKANVRTHV